MGTKTLPYNTSLSYLNCGQLQQHPPESLVLQSKLIFSNDTLLFIFTSGTCKTEQYNREHEISKNEHITEDDHSCIPTVNEVIFLPIL